MTYTDWRGTLAICPKRHKPRWKRAKEAERKAA